MQTVTLKLSSLGSVGAISSMENRIKSCQCVASLEVGGEWKKVGWQLWVKVMCMHRPTNSPVYYLSLAMSVYYENASFLMSFSLGK